MAFEEKCFHRTVNTGIHLYGLGFFSLFIGFMFYLAGATLILPFSFVEIAALLIAYFYNAVHANDYEKLTVEGNHIKIESKVKN